MLWKREKCNWWTRSLAHTRSTPRVKFATSRFPTFSLGSIFFPITITSKAVKIHCWQKNWCWITSRKLSSTSRFSACSAVSTATWRRISSAILARNNTPKTTKRLKVHNFYIIFLELYCLFIYLADPGIFLLSTMQVRRNAIVPDRGPFDVWWAPAGCCCFESICANCDKKADLLLLLQSVSSKISAQHSAKTAPLEISRNFLLVVANIHMQGLQVQLQ